MVVTDFVTGSSFELLQACVRGWNINKRRIQAHIVLPKIFELLQDVVQVASSQLFDHRAVEQSNFVLEADPNTSPWCSLLESGHVIEASAPNGQAGLQL